MQGTIRWIGLLLMCSMGSLTLSWSRGQERPLPKPRSRLSFSMLPRLTKEVVSVKPARDLSKFGPLQSRCI